MKVPLHFVNAETSPGVKLPAASPARDERARGALPAEGPARVHRGGPRPDAGGALGARLPPAASGGGRGRGAEGRGPHRGHHRDPARRDGRGRGRGSRGDRAVGRRRAELGPEGEGGGGRGRGRPRGQAGREEERADPPRGSARRPSGGHFVFTPPWKTSDSSWAWETPGESTSRPATTRASGGWTPSPGASARAGRAQAKFSGWTSRIEEGGRDIRLLKPATYMNESGRSVGRDSALLQDRARADAGRARRARPAAGQREAEEGRRHGRAQRPQGHRRGGGHEGLLAPAHRHRPSGRQGRRWPITCSPRRGARSRRRSSRRSRGAWTCWRASPPGGCRTR